MDRFFLAPLACLVVSCATAPDQNTATTAPPAPAPATESALGNEFILSQGQYFRLPVAQVNPRIYAAFSTAWTFDGEFPAELLKKIQGHPAYQAAESDPLLQPQENESTQESGYVRWIPNEGNDESAAALLWYLNGERKELVLSVDVLLDPNAKNDSRRDLFASLETIVDLKQSMISRAEFSDILLTNLSGAQTSHELRVSFTGSLTKEGYQSVRSANQLQAGEVTRTLDELWQVELKNESHHGITLGWLGYEHLRHGLLIVMNHPAETIEFQCTVAGEAFPLDLIRRQLEEGWPLVLRGYQHAGATEDGTNAFRPVEYMLFKETGLAE